MTTWQIVRIVAGSFVLLSLALGSRQSPIFISEYWLLFTVFVGVNLLQSGVSRWCLMETLLRKAGIKPGP